MNIGAILNIGLSVVFAYGAHSGIKSGLLVGIFGKLEKTERPKTFWFFIGALVAVSIANILLFIDKLK